MSGKDDVSRNVAMAEDAESDRRAAEEREAAIAQAKALREQARAGGLRFDAYLPPSLADWLLGLIESGVFADPSEAAFFIFGERRDLQPHADLRRELLNRTLKAAIGDPRPPIAAEEVMEELWRRIEPPRPEPALWRRNLAAAIAIPPTLKSIRTEADYQAALKRIDALMGAEQGTPEGHELDILADLVDLYEARQMPEFTRPENPRHRRPRA
jgi:hypothetical protein